MTTPSSAVVLGIAVAYLAACLAFGLLPGRKASTSPEGYVAGDRSLGLVLMYFITGATHLLGLRLPERARLGLLPRRRRILHPGQA